MSAGRTNLDQWMERPPAEAESRTELLICPAIGCVCAIVTLLSAGNICTCNDRDQSYLAAISLSTPSFGLYLRCPTYRLAGKHRGARRPASPPARGARGRPGGGGGRPKRTAPATAGPAREPPAHAMNGRGRSATPRPGHRAPAPTGAPAEISSDVVHLAPQTCIPAAVGGRPGRPSRRRPPGHTPSRKAPCGTRLPRRRAPRGAAGRPAAAGAPPPFGRVRDRGDPPRDERR